MYAPIESMSNIDIYIFDRPFSLVPSIIDENEQDMDNCGKQMGFNQDCRSPYEEHTTILAGMIYCQICYGVQCMPLQRRNEKIIGLISDKFP